MHDTAPVEGRTFGPYDDEPMAGATVDPSPTISQGIEGNYRREIESDGHTTVTFQVTMTDPELAAIEACLATLQTLHYNTRVRALTYIKDRIESDPAVWGPDTPRPTQ